MPSCRVCLQGSIPSAWDQDIVLQELKLANNALTGEELHCLVQCTCC